MKLVIFLSILRLRHILQKKMFCNIQGYDGVYVLHDGDELIIYTEDRCAIIWKGIVHLEYER